MGWKDAPEVSEKWQTAPEVGSPPADNGVDPVAVEDQPGWDWLRNTMPRTFNAGHEFVAGFSQGIGNLPNAPSNLINGVQSLADLHFGSGEGKVAYEVPQLMGDGALIPNLYDKSIEELNPQTPGYEGWRQAGKVSGTAAPFGVGAMVAAPLLSTAGGSVGHVIDTSIDPNEHQKWERTIPALLPIATRGLAPLISKTPNSATVGGATLLTTGNPTAALLASSLNTAAKVGTKGITSMSPTGLVGASLAPLAVDDPRWAR